MYIVVSSIKYIHSIYLDLIICRRMETVRQVPFILWNSLHIAYHSSSLLGPSYLLHLFICSLRWKRRASGKFGGRSGTLMVTFSLCSSILSGVLVV